MAMKVKSAVVYIITSHRLCKIGAILSSIHMRHLFSYLVLHYSCSSVYLDRTVTIADLVEDSAKTYSNAHIDGQTHPVVTYVPMHIQE